MKRFTRVGLLAISIVGSFTPTVSLADPCDKQTLESMLLAAVAGIQPPLSDAQQTQLLENLVSSPWCKPSEAEVNNAKVVEPAEVDERPIATIQKQPENSSSAWPPPKREDFIIRDRIDGAFKGWRGKTVFKLSNGQRWVQRQRGYYRADLDSPEITITRNALGFFVMEIVSTGRRVPVKPVRD